MIVLFLVNRGSLPDGRRIFTSTAVTVMFSICLSLSSYICVVDDIVCIRVLENVRFG